MCEAVLQEWGVIAWPRASFARRATGRGKAASAFARAEVIVLHTAASEATYRVVRRCNGTVSIILLPLRLLICFESLVTIVLRSCTSVKLIGCDSAVSLGASARPHYTENMACRHQRRAIGYSG